MLKERDGMSISDKAIEAAAEVMAVELGTPSNPHIYRHLARKTLEAAAPHMLTEALEGNK